MPLKDFHTRIKPLALASGHGRYITVTPEQMRPLGNGRYIYQPGDYTIVDKIHHSHCVHFTAPQKFHDFNAKNVLCPKIMLF
jgi:hypothetical protein